VYPPAQLLVEKMGNFTDVALKSYKEKNKTAMAYRGQGEGVCTAKVGHRGRLDGPAGNQMSGHGGPKGEM